MKSKFIQILTLSLMMVFQVALAQQTVTGSVSDEDGNLLPGATVVIKGTSSAATTDFNGNFTIKADNGDTLIISYVGFNSQEISVNGSTISAILTSSTKLEEGVVTAYGVDRAKNELTYQTEKIGGESVSSNSFTSASSALAGKVAGMQINIQNNGVNPSSKIILRGFRSISGGNEALIVIDGAIASKGAFDDLNPIDIESLNVLKGATAAAIYGSNASNGAVIVTTKQGNNNSKFTIGINSTYTTEEIAYTPEFQTEYGTGWDGHYDPIENTNWGPRFDGVLRRVGPLFPVGTVLPEGTFQTTPDGQPYQVLPYAPVQDHIKDFFETGETFQNSVYFRGGDSTSNIYLSMGNQQTKGIILRDSYKRSTIKLNASKQIGDVKVGINSNLLMDKTSEVGNSIGDQDREFYWFVVNTPANIPLKNIICIEKFLDVKSCNYIIEKAEKTNLWSTNRHDNYPTTDIPFDNIVEIKSNTKQNIINKIINNVKKYYNLEDKCEIDPFDVFVVKYDINGQTGLDIHRDHSEISFVLLLSDPNNFEGGGTYYKEKNILINPQHQGSLALHCGKTKHSGKYISKGVRYILIGFFNIKSNKILNISKNDKDYMKLELPDKRFYDYLWINNHNIKTKQFIIFVKIINLKKRNEKLKQILNRISNLKIPNNIQIKLDIKEANIGNYGKAFPNWTKFKDIVNNKFKNYYEREITNGEIGCFNSHIEIIKDFDIKNIGKDNNFLLILEDDATFANDFIYRISQSIYELENNNILWDAIDFGGQNIDNNKDIKISESIVKKSALFETHAILYSLNGIKKNTEY